MPVEVKRLGITRLMARALLKHCPVCGESGIWVSRSQLRTHCSRCRFPFERESGYWVGAIIVDTGVTEALFGLLFVGTLVLTWPETPWQPLLMVALVTNTLVPWFFYPRSKTIWLALDLYFNRRRAEQADQ